MAVVAICANSAYASSRLSVHLRPSSHLFARCCVKATAAMVARAVIVFPAQADFHHSTGASVVGCVRTDTKPMSSTICDRAALVMRGRPILARTFFTSSNRRPDETDTSRRGHDARSSGTLRLGSWPTPVQVIQDNSRTKQACTSSASSSEPARKSTQPPCNCRALERAIVQ